MSQGQASLTDFEVATPVSWPAFSDKTGVYVNQAFHTDRWAPAPLTFSVSFTLSDGCLQGKAVRSVLTIFYETQELSCYFPLYKYRPDQRSCDSITGFRKIKTIFLIFLHCIVWSGRNSRDSTLRRMEAQNIFLPLVVIFLYLPFRSYLLLNIMRPFLLKWTGHVTQSRQLTRNSNKKVFHWHFCKNPLAIFDCFFFFRDQCFFAIFSFFYFWGNGNAARHAANGI